MPRYPQPAPLPIFAGPYSRRRLVWLRAPVRQFGMTVAAVMATGLLLALVF